MVRDVVLGRRRALFLLALKNVLRKKAVACLALLGVGLGSSLIIVLLSLSGSLNRNLDRTVSALAGKLVVSPRDALFGGIFFGSGTPLPPGDLATVRETKGVRNAYGRVSASLHPADFPDLVLPFTGYSPEEIQAAAGTPFAEVVRGRAPANDKEIIVGRRLVDTLSFLGRKLAVGDTPSFQLPDGATIDLRVTGVFQTGDEITDTSVAGSIGLARQLASLPQNDYSSLAVRVERPDEVLPVEQSLLAEMAKSDPPVQVVAPKNLLDPLAASTKAVDRLLLAISLLSALGSTLFISIIMSITVVERMKEFAVLKAVGWCGRHVTTLVLAESLILSLAGTALGLALGCGGALVLGRWLKPGVPAWPQLVQVAVLAVLVGTVGGIFPAWRAGRVAPALILHQG
ncbi:MAG: ABC transporter permease [Peptococcaceae bacterium]|nr:ABC transporter permease [Peptococcaceae bacterium]